MATRDEMQQWFEARYELAVDAWFYDTKVTDLQRVTTPVEPAQALAAHFPDATAAEIEALAQDLATEGTWLDTSSEKPLDPETTVN